MSGPRNYVRPMTGWYRRNPRFLRYMLRELTAVFLAGYAVLLLIGLAALARGPEAWDGYVAFLASPLSIALHTVILIAALYNAATWFAVSPKAMPPLRLGSRRVPDRLIVGGQAVALVVISIVMVALVRAA